MGPSVARHSVCPCPHEMDRLLSSTASTTTTLGPLNQPQPSALMAGILALMFPLRSGRDHPNLVTLSKGSASWKQSISAFGICIPWSWPRGTFQC